ncbi:MAG: hypothetical protein IT204_13655 [Fimbriimonadaceae bacterium]|nr:hypothetical protein [Fimbriimonadaceae bacterium]
MSWLDGGLALAGLLAAGGLTLAEVAGYRDSRVVRPHALILRRAPLRALALALVAIHLQRLLLTASLAVRHDLDVFLLRRPLPASAPDLGWTWLLVRLGCSLLLAALTLPRAAGAALLSGVAWALPSAALAAAWLLPLRDGHGRLGLLLASAVALPAALLANRLWRTCLSARDAEPELLATALNRLSRRLLVVLLPAGVWLLRPVWQSAWLPATIAALTTAVALGASWRVVRRAWQRGGGERGELARFVWGAGRRVAWRYLTVVALILHWGLLGSLLPAAAAGAQAAQQDITRWPQLLTGRAEPTSGDWERAALRLAELRRRYAPHPWCGQWMLLEAWIQGWRLHRSQTTRLLLSEASHQYRRAPAVPPPGWPAGRRVGELAAAALRQWGEVLEPGAGPA